MEKLTGKIKFLPFAIETKSESLRPYLVDKDGNTIMVYKKNDNPFMNDYFTTWADKNVVLTGEYSDKTFIVDGVEENPDTITEEDCDSEKSVDESKDKNEED